MPDDLDASTSVPVEDEDVLRFRFIAGPGRPVRYWIRLDIGRIAEEREILAVNRAIRKAGR